MTRLAGVSIVAIAAFALTWAIIPTSADRPTAPQPAAAVPTGDAAPLLVLRPAFIDMGPLKRHSTHAVSAELRNAGQADLVIERTEVACRCFTASLDKWRLRPGESATLKVNVKTLSHRGEMAERIGIASNDPAGVRTLDLRFEVPDDPAPDPERLYLVWTAPGEEAGGRVKVRTGSDDAIRLLYAVGSAADVSGTVVRAELTGGSPGELLVRFKAPDKPGTHRRRVTVVLARDGDEDSTSAGGQSRPTVRVPVVVCVSRVARVSPGRLDFGRFARGCRVTRSLEVDLAEGSRIVSVTPRPEVFDTTVLEPRPSGRGHSVEIQLTVRPDAPYGPFRGELALHIAGGEYSTLVVPFEGYVEEAAAVSGNSGSR